jgi:hypothetical protein
MRVHNVHGFFGGARCRHRVEDKMGGLSTLCGELLIVPPPPAELNIRRMNGGRETAIPLRSSTSVALTLAEQTSRVSEYPQVSKLKKKSVFS